MWSLEHTIVIELVKRTNQSMFNDDITGPVEKFNQRGQKIIERSNFDSMLGAIVAKRREPTVMSIIAK